MSFGDFRARHRAPVISLLCLLSSLYSFPAKTRSIPAWSPATEHAARPRPRTRPRGRGAYGLNPPIHPPTRPPSHPPCSRLRQGSTTARPFDRVPAFITCPGQARGAVPVPVGGVRLRHALRASRYKKSRRPEASRSLIGRNGRKPPAAPTSMRICRGGFPPPARPKRTRPRLLDLVDDLHVAPPRAGGRRGGRLCLLLVLTPRPAVPPDVKRLLQLAHPHVIPANAHTRTQRCTGQRNPNQAA